MEFLSLSRRRSSARNVPSGEERGETDVFAGYKLKKRYLDGISRYLEMFDPFSRDAFHDRTSVDKSLFSWEHEVCHHQKNILFSFSLGL